MILSSGIFKQTLIVRFLDDKIFGSNLWLENYSNGGKKLILSFVVIYQTIKSNGGKIWKQFNVEGKL